MLEPDLAASRGYEIGGKVSSEVDMHLLFYGVRPDINAVAGRGLGRALLPEVIIGSGKIPLVEYATPGRPTSALEPFVPHYDALLLATTAPPRYAQCVSTETIRLLPCTIKNYGGKPHLGVGLATEASVPDFL